MRQCSLNSTHSGPIRMYMWNTYTYLRGKRTLESHEGLLCEKCAKSLGAWQKIKSDQLFDDINGIIERRTN